MSSYCKFVKDLPQENLHSIYHDTQYGFRIESDDELFGRLILEINQAGLSWDTILKKQKPIKKAYADFRISEVAQFDQKDIERLLDDPGIIRNKLKINAIIRNAQQIVELQRDHGSFDKWLLDQGKLDLTDWVKLFKKTFKFTGGEITKEFLVSTGYVPGAHDKNCPVYLKIQKQF